MNIIKTGRQFTLNNNVRPCMDDDWTETASISVAPEGDSTKRPMTDTHRKKHL